MVARERHSTATAALDGVAGDVATGEDAAGRRIDGRSPQAVVFPTDIQELRRVLEVASEENIALAPWGGGTLMSLGNRPERLDVVVDLSRLDRVIEFSPADLTATVQAGITFSKLGEVLEQHRQFLAIDPPLPDRATVGGTLASGISGPLKWQYGSPRDTVIGIKVVHADGVVTKSGGRVVKNVSGYDMTRLHVGGLGTLGVVVEVSFKLTPNPAGQATVVATFEEFSTCIEAGLGVFGSDVVPLALTAFDGGTSDRMRRAQITGRGLLAVRLGGRPRTLDRRTRETRSICGRHGASRIEVLQDGESESLWRSLADFGYENDEPPLVRGRASVLPSRVPEVAEKLGATGASAGLHLALAVQPAHGTVLANWFADGGDPAHDEVSRAIRAARRVAHEAGGRIVIEKCPAAVKDGIDVWDDVGGALAIMRRLKEQYDPDRILNPGRYAGGI